MCLSTYLILKYSKFHDLCALSTWHLLLFLPLIFLFICIIIINTIWYSPYVNSLPRQAFLYSHNFNFFFSRFLLICQFYHLCGSIKTSSPRHLVEKRVSHKPTGKKVITRNLITTVKKEGKKGMVNPLCNQRLSCVSISTNVNDNLTVATIRPRDICTLYKIGSNPCIV